jgi:hypothetical protein
MNFNQPKRTMTATKHWHHHQRATQDCPLIDHQTAENRDLKTVAGRGALLFHIRIGGMGMRSVYAAFRGPTQLRAEQVALAWCRTRWARDKRALFVERTEYVDQEGGDQ